MSIITINGTDLELDLLDADVMEKYQNLNDEIVRKIQEPTQYENISTADGMRKQCRYVDEFFDSLFGAGTAVKLFGGGNNLGIRIDAFAKVSKASDGIRGEMNSIINKYGVGRIQNREQRRFQNGKHGRKNKNRSHAGNR